ncbi:hypothetical protein EOPP23_13240 [Endozoicomonas sp. OPT23]|nr:hypothetical protein [Endozoicomonas sp. OPT23]
MSLPVTYIPETQEVEPAPNTNTDSDLNEFQETEVADTQTIGSVDEVTAQVTDISDQKPAETQQNVEPDTEDANEDVTDSSNTDVQEIESVETPEDTFEASQKIIEPLTESVPEKQKNSDETEEIEINPEQKQPEDTNDLPVKKLMPIILPESVSPNANPPFVNSNPGAPPPAKLPPIDTSGDISPIEEPDLVPKINNYKKLSYSVAARFKQLIDKAQAKFVRVKRSLTKWTSFYFYQTSAYLTAASGKLISKFTGSHKPRKYVIKSKRPHTTTPSYLWLTPFKLFQFSKRSTPIIITAAATGAFAYIMYPESEKQSVPLQRKPSKRKIKKTGRSQSTEDEINAILSNQLIHAFSSAGHLLKKYGAFPVTAVYQFNESILNILSGPLQVSENQSLFFGPVGYPVTDSQFQNTPVFDAPLSESLIEETVERLINSVSASQLRLAITGPLDPVSQVLMWCGIPYGNHAKQFHKQCISWLATELEKQHNWYQNDLHFHYFMLQTGMYQFFPERTKLMVIPRFSLINGLEKVTQGYQPRVLEISSAEKYTYNLPFPTDTNPIPIAIEPTWLGDSPFSIYKLREFQDKQHIFSSNLTPGQPIDGIYSDTVYSFTVQKDTDLLAAIETQVIDSHTPQPQARLPHSRIFEKLLQAKPNTHLSHTRPFRFDNDSSTGKSTRVADAIRYYLNTDQYNKVNQLQELAVSPWFPKGELPYTLLAKATGLSLDSFKDIDSLSVNARIKKFDQLFECSFMPDCSDKSHPQMRILDNIPPTADALSGGKESDFGQPEMLSSKALCQKISFNNLRDACLSVNNDLLKVTEALSLNSQLSIDTHIPIYKYECTYDQEEAGTCYYRLNRKIPFSEVSDERLITHLNLKAILTEQNQHQENPLLYLSHIGILEASEFPNGSPDYLQLYKQLEIDRNFDQNYGCFHKYLHQYEWCSGQTSCLWTVPTIKSDNRENRLELLDQVVETGQGIITGRWAEASKKGGMLVNGGKENTGILYRDIHNTGWIETYDAKDEKTGYLLLAYYNNKPFLITQSSNNNPHHTFKALFMIRGTERINSPCNQPDQSIIVYPD